MKYIKEFEGLRGLMALWVVIGHWATSVPLSFHPLPPKLYNAYAVDVFIMLSGFAIFSLLEKKHEKYLPYILRRFFRIYPIYLLYLVISIVTIPLALDAFTHAPGAYMQDRRVDIINNTVANWWPHLIAHLTLVHGLIPEKLLPDTNFAFLGQAWSLSLEWQFYLLAPLLLFFVHRAKRLTTLLLLIAVTLISVALSRKFGGGFLGAKLHLFGVGIASVYLMRFLLSKDTVFDYRRIRPALVALLCLLLFLKSASALPYMIWLVMIYVVIASQQSSDPIANIASRFMQSWPIQWLGHISYSVYLSHLIVIFVSLHFLESFPGLSRHQFAFALLCLVVPGTIALSSISYLLVEKPFMRLAKMWADRLGRTQADAVRAET